MRSASKRYGFRPGILPTLGAAALMGLFIALGVWQLNRAQEKQAMLLQYEARNQRPAVELRPPVADMPSWRHRRVRVTGHFDADRQFLLDNQVYRGRAGYHVLTPLVLAQDQSRVLVDRGWVPLGASRDQLPQVSVTTGEVTLEGLVYVPYEEAYSLGNMDTGESGWPLRVQYIDFEQMAKRLEAPLAKMIIRLDTQSPYGYRREWQIAPFTPERHLGYAVQWFAFAATLLAIYLVVNFKRVDKE
jgi:surfeit locus 1 family protein